MRYDYQCESCNDVTEHWMPFEDRHTPKTCPMCGGKSTYQFPVSATFQPFEAYYDEALGMDVRGRKEKREVLRAMGRVEAGDRRNGARNMETSPNTVMVKPLPEKGITLSDIQRRENLNRKALESFEIGVREKATGKTIMPKTRLVDLPNA